MALLTLMVLFFVGGVANAAPQTVSVQVSVEMLNLNGSAAARVTAVNADTASMSITLADAYENRQTFSAVESGDSVIVTFVTNQSAVAGYTVQVIARTADGRSSARGYGGQSTPLPEPTPLSQNPVRYCEGPNYDFGRCMAQWMNLPIR